MNESIVIGLLTTSMFEMTKDPGGSDPGGKSASVGVIGGDKLCRLSNDVVS